jgi:Cu/Ag efflux pump CusA
LHSDPFQDCGHPTFGAGKAPRYIAFGNVGNLLLVLVNVPFAFVGGLLAVMLAGGELSLGSMVGFVTLFGITMRKLDHDDIALRARYSVEGVTWDHDAAMRGASERLLPILMTAVVTELGLVPLAFGSGTAGREIEGPMAIIILGALLTSTALNLMVLPTLALRYGRSRSPQPMRCVSSSSSPRASARPM